MRQAEDELTSLEEEGLLRRLRSLNPGDAPFLLLDGRRIINFSSNDYLGLARDEELVAAAQEAAARFGAGSGSSRLICGSLSPHHELEETIAAWKNTEAALSFSNGYAAAVGTLTSILRRGDVVILDKLSHACLIDGARLSEATLRVFPHNNLDKLEQLLARAREKLPAGARVLVVTESIFSMDGDRAPLAELVSIVERHGALLLVDEAHAVGVMGMRGEGLVAELGVQEGVTFQMGTLGKAVGSAGGYLAAERRWIDLILNNARSFIFSTAPPPAQVAASQRGLEIIASARGRRLRDRLWENIALFSRIRDQKSQSSILPVVIGENEAALRAAENLLKAGFLAPAVRFPSVPRGSARLRITLSAAHDEDQISALHARLQTLP
ncbi:MAG: 8-amino-7-oxononanoate synthase [Roseibacillus sp.]|nr:8-amino-7-oxononanoate synthase [Roseibacillus sp.]